MTKKITIEKNDGIAEVIDRVLAESAENVIVAVPKGSVLGKSPRNFALLAREADAEGKSVIIESTDEAIMASARAAGLTKLVESAPTAHPHAATGVSDIVPIRRQQTELETSDEDEEESSPAAASTNKRRSPGEIRRKIEVAPEDDETGKEADEETTEESDEEATNDTKSSNTFFAGQQNRFFKDRKLDETPNEEDADDAKGFPWKWVGAIIMVAVIVALGAWIVAVDFGHVAVTINFTKTPWQYQGNFTADKAASSIDPTSNVLPAQVFSINKNTTQLFPATSEQNVSTKATGVLTIYNAYSSAAQSLVATTRFVTPDGKIFRLANSVIVPGAKITNGQIVPSSINAQVVADQAGPNYNVGPVAKLTVPGFANSPKFQGFYGALTSSTAGGFTGQRAVPTANDITAAKAKMTSLLQSDLQNSLTGTYPNNFIILPGASAVQITKLTVNTTTDQNGNFSVFGEATLSAIGFDQTAFKSFLLSLAQTTEQNSSFSSFTPQYSNVTPDFTNGRLNFTINAQGSLEPAFASSTFDGTISGKSIAEARTAIASLPQLQNGTISVWPSWLWNIPTDPKKIELSAN